jgi:hypothetical protein
MKPDFPGKEAPHACFFFFFFFFFLSWWEGEGREDVYHSADAPIPSPPGGIGRAGAVSCVRMTARECSAWTLVGVFVALEDVGGGRMCVTAQTRPFPPLRGELGVPVL